MALSDITDPQAVRAAVAEYDRSGRREFLRQYGFGKADAYFLVLDGRRYDSKAIAGVAHRYQFPSAGPLTPGDFAGGEPVVRKLVNDLGFSVEGPNEGVDGERQRRKQIWRQMLERRGPKRLERQAIRDLRAYGGAQGIWVDQERTGHLTPDGSGVAVSVLHTGKHYADALTDEGLIYHYPNTERGRKDAREVQALKNAAEFHLPIFAVLPSDSSNLRDVRLGYVLDWDDEAAHFLIGFVEELNDGPPSLRAEEPFRLTSTRKEKQRSVTQRARSPVFHFEVMKRYGRECAFCRIDEPHLLQAAHIRPVSQNGSDDPRNGLPLCANHHLAFDKGLLAIRPNDNAVVAPDGSTTKDRLGVTKADLTELKALPHDDAVRWHWEKHA